MEAFTNVLGHSTNLLTDVRKKEKENVVCYDSWVKNNSNKNI